MKIMFFAPWTRNIPLLRPLVASLKTRNVDTMLLHYGSWDYDQRRPSEEFIDGLLCRDISYYGTRFIHKVLARERPDCIVTITPSKLMDRAMIMSARTLGIPTVFLMHGILSTTNAAIHNEAAVLKAPLRRMRITKLPKYAQHMIPNYFYSGTKEKNGFLLSIEPYRMLLETFRYPERWQFQPNPSKEVQCTKCLAWGAAYGRHIRKVYGYSDESVMVVGHPPLDKACKLLTEPPTNETIENLKGTYGIGKSTKLVLYIEGAFIDSGFAGWTSESLVQHLREVAGLTAAAGYHLVVKLHPSTRGLQWFQSHLQGLATVVDDADAETLIWMADSVIGHMSTLINSAIALNKLVLIPRWGISRDIPAIFDDVAPVCVCATPDQLSQALEQPSNFTPACHVRRAQYIREYLEPLDGRSEERICDAIFELASGLGVDSASCRAA